MLGILLSDTASNKNVLQPTKSWRPNKENLMPFQAKKLVKQEKTFSMSVALLVHHGRFPHCFLFPFKCMVLGQQRGGLLFGGWWTWHVPSCTFARAHLTVCLSTSVYFQFSSSVPSSPKELTAPMDISNSTAAKWLTSFW